MDGIGLPNLVIGMVLILLLVEYGLGSDGSVHKEHIDVVLILLLVEYGLGC